MLAAILDREPAPLARFEPDAPPELQRIVTKALRKDRAQRYQRIKDLQLDLQALRGDLAAHPPGEQVESPLVGLRNVDTGCHFPGGATTFERGVPRHASEPAQAAGCVSRGATALLAIVGAVWWTAVDRRVSQPRRLTEAALTRLTANASRNPVISARISPDGRYLAYADATGIQVQFIESGVTQRIPDSQGMNVYAWSVDSTRGRASACEAGTCAGWDISLVGGARRRTGITWPESEVVRAAGDGSRILRVTNDESQLKVDSLNGTPPRVLARRSRLGCDPELGRNPNTVCKTGWICRRRHSTGQWPSDDSVQNRSR